MIAEYLPTSRPAPAWHTRFIVMLPAISKQARIAFRGLGPEAREEAVAEVIANCFVAYVRLVELGKESIAFATPLAMFAIRQFHDGRRVGSRQCRRDLYSRHSQAEGGYKLKHIGTPHGCSDSWREQLTDNHRTPVPDQAAFRIDFPAWLATLRPRDCRLVLQLAQGERTGALAKRFGLSPGRVSQLRREFCTAWQTFVGDNDEPHTASAASAC